MIRQWRARRAERAIRRQVDTVLDLADCLTLSSAIVLMDASSTVLAESSRVARAYELARATGHPCLRRRPGA